MIKNKLSVKRTTYKLSRWQKFKIWFNTKVLRKKMVVILREKPEMWVDPEVFESNLFQDFLDRTEESLLFKEEEDD